jgi:hypothetical protein
MGEDTIKIVTLKEIRNKLLQRVEYYEEAYMEYGHNSICNRISQLYEDIELIEKEVEKISPADCDWKI